MSFLAKLLGKLSAKLSGPPVQALTLPQESRELKVLADYEEEVMLRQMRLGIGNDLYSLARSYWDEYAKGDRSRLLEFILHGLVEDQFESSCVLSFWYELADQQMFVQFKERKGPPSLYGYMPINAQEAESIYRATSKGIWVWDNLRIRGTKLGHRKQYALVAGERLWDRTARTAEEHASEVDRQSGVRVPGEKIGRFERDLPLDN